jgi:hypothetical protein
MPTSEQLATLEPDDFLKSSVFSADSADETA